MNKQVEFSEIEFYEQEYKITTSLNFEEKKKAYRLRHDVFANELKWVSPQTGDFDVDVYDTEGMVYVSVYDKSHKVIAHLRITRPDKTFMMEEVFAILLEDNPIGKTKESIEVSRVCTDINARSLKISTSCGETPLSLLLYKGLFLWCERNVISKMFMVVERKLYRLLRMTGFPCKMIGESTMPDGVSATALYIDWREFKLINMEKRKEFYKWFSSYEEQKLDMVA